MKDTVEQITLTSIITNLKSKKGNIDEDKIFAKEIVYNNQIATTFFLGDYSTPLLRYIASAILRLEHFFDHVEPYQNIMGDFYTFIAAPFTGIDNNPQWHKIDLYKGENKARLYTYVSRITIRFFIKNKKEYAVRDKKSVDVLEFVDYGALLKGEYIEEESAEDNIQPLQKLRKAYLKLKERDRSVLQCLVLEKMHWAEAFEILRIYLDPLGPDKSWEGWSYEQKQNAIDEFWDNKQKQDAMAGLKKRAIEHLAKRYFENNLTDQKHHATF